MDKNVLKWILIIGGALLFIGGGAVVVSNLEMIASKIAQAIAVAEGFFVVGSRPHRNNNPGDLKVDVTGAGVGMDDAGFVIYGTQEDGWDALRRQVMKMLTNTSRIYTSDMSIEEVASHYTTTEQDTWANNVASHLGVTPDTKLSEIA